MVHRLNKPTISLNNVLNDCSGTITDPEKKGRILSYHSIIKEDSRNFERSMSSSTEFVICNHSFQKELLKEDMKWLYSKRFAEKGSAGRKYYDELQFSVSNGRCPYCLDGDARNGEIDHYLPKATYPSLSVTCLNLVPVCKPCNKDKLDDVDLFPNPYFDDIDKDIYLRCKIILQDESLLVDYKVEKPSGIETSLFEKIETMVKRPRLFELYGTRAVSEVNSMKYDLKKNLAQGDKSGLKDHISDILKGKIEYFGLNSWQAAIYRELLNNTDLLISYLNI